MLVSEVHADGIDLVMTEVDVECAIPVSAGTKGNGLSGKRLAQTEVLAAKADPAAILDPADLIVGSVLDRR